MLATALSTGLVIAVLFTVPVAIWRIAKRSGHGTTWDALFAAHCVLAAAVCLGVTKFDVVHPYCNGFYEWPPCWFVKTIGWIGTLFIPASLGLLMILAFKKWPSQALPGNGG